MRAALCNREHLSSELNVYLLKMVRAIIINNNIKQKDNNAKADDYIKREDI